MLLLSEFFIGIDKPVGRTVMGFHLFRTFQLRQYLIGQLFAQFDTPLVKTENIPYYSLYKDFMLIHGYEAAECLWCDFIHQY